MNVLRVFIGASHADDFRIGGGFQKEENTISLIENEDAQLEMTLRREGRDATIDSRWINLLFNSKNGAWVQSVGELIRWYQAPHRMPLIYRKLLNALWWYGEAVSEPLPHAKIIRYCNALEAYLATGDKNISHQIAVRAAYLCSEDIVLEAAGWFDDVKKLYRLRSRLVHGRLSPFDAKLTDGWQLGERITRRTLLHGLEWTLWLSHKDFRMNEKRVGQHFDCDLPLFSFGMPN